MQRNWIGRSEGARVKFPIAGAPATTVEVFTTRIDTIYGATFVVLAPEHPLVERFAAERRRSGGVPRAGRRRSARRTARRAAWAVEKEGFDTGRTGDQPVHRQAGADLGRQLRAWRVRHRRDHGACPAHDERDFEFARTYNLPITIVVQRDGEPLVGRDDDRGARRRRRAGQFRRVQRPAVGRGEPPDDRRRRGARHRQGRGAVPAEGLGHLAAALLGHADPGRPLREGRRRAGAVRRAAGRAAEGRRRSPAAATRRWRRCRSSST